MGQKHLAGQFTKDDIYKFSIAHSLTHRQNWLDTHERKADSAVTSNSVTILDRCTIEDVRNTSSISSGRLHVEEEDDDEAANDSFES